MQKTLCIIAAWQFCQAAFVYKNEYERKNLNSKFLSDFYMMISVVFQKKFGGMKKGL